MVTILRKWCPNINLKKVVSFRKRFPNIYLKKGVSQCLPWERNVPMFTYRKGCPNVYLRSGVPMFALRKVCRAILISESGFTMFTLRKCCPNVYLEKGVSQSTLGKHFSIPGILANRSINPCLTYNIHILLLLDVKLL